MPLHPSIESPVPGSSGFRRIPDNLDQRMVRFNGLDPPKLAVQSTVLDAGARFQTTEQDLPALLIAEARVSV